MGSRLEKNSEAVRKRIAAHAFENEEGEEYEGSKFGGFPEYFRRKKIKLQNLDAELRSSSAKPQVFRGIVAHVNGYTQPSLNDLHHLIVSHGGGFLQYLDGKTTVTHIIASNLTPKKVVEFRRYRIVKPAWIVDSVSAGRLLPWNDYRVLDEGVNQRLLGFEEGKIVSQANAQRAGYRDQTDKSWYTDQVKKVVEDIDDVAGAHFPSSQAMTYNGQGPKSLWKPGTGEAADTPVIAQDQTIDEGPDSSGSFEITASLEQIMNGESENHDQFSDHSKNVTSQSLEDATNGNSYEGEAVQLEAIANEPLPNEVPSTGGSPEKNFKPQTAEEHNAVLLADPRMWKSSTANPDFIKQYYSESRLHHLSTWKADLKSRFQQMASERSASQRQPTSRKPGARRYILHVDFDSFFCAVSLKNAPEHSNKPAVVAHGTGTGSEIASCNYAARAFGIKNGMWMKKALDLCSDIKVLPYDFPAYERASEGFYDAILDVGGIVQSVSVDEALVDVTSLCLAAGGSDGVGIREGSIWREQAQADMIASNLRQRIYDVTGCAVSVGIGGNIMLAKVALRKAKPAGQYQIKPEEALGFLGELSMQDLPGIAYSIGGRLEEIGVKFVKDVRSLSKDRLMTVLGPKTGEKIWDYSRGIDRTEVGELTVRKSVSAEINWGIRFISQLEAEEFVQNLCIELQRRLVDQRVKGRQLTVKIMRKAASAPIDPPKHLGHGECDTFNKSIVLGVATNDAMTIGREAISILRGYGFSPGELRGLGVQMTKLEQIKSSMFQDGSQRRISFAPAVPKLNQQISDDITDEPETPKKMLETLNDQTKARLDPILDVKTPRMSRTAVPAVQGDRRMVQLDDLVDPETPSKRRGTLAPRQKGGSNDPIDECSPLKPKATPVHPAMAIARANATDTSAKRLNLQGNQFLSAKKPSISSTQFILPSQIDPEVLDQLPHDIRSRLVTQSKSQARGGSEKAAVLVQDKNLERVGSEERTLAGEFNQGNPLPRTKALAHDSRLDNASDFKNVSLLPSQLDADVLEALPEDVRAEILASYTTHAFRSRGQTVLPQSPRKVRTIAEPTKKKLITPPKKRGRGRPSRVEMRAKLDKEAASNYTQSNFVAGKRGRALNAEPASESEGHVSDALDPEFLCALPEDVRQEVVHEHRQKMLAKKAGLTTTLMKKKRAAASEGPVGPRRLRLPMRDARPTFTTQELSSLPELRDSMTAWFREHSDDGPHPDDVAALERYLRRVVLEERNMEKVVGVIKWLAFLADDAERSTWDGVVDGIKEKLQAAVTERGLGTLVF